MFPEQALLYLASMAKEQHPKAPQGMWLDWEVLGDRAFPAWQARWGVVL